MKLKYKIKGKNISLYTIEENNIEQIRIWRNQKEVKDYFIYDKTISKEQQIKWYKKYSENSNDYMFMIYNHKINKNIGCISMLNYNTDNKSIEIGRVFIGDLDNRNKGYGIEALKLICKLAYKIYDLNKIFLEVISTNKIAIKTYEKVGFTINDTINKDNKTLYIMEYTNN